LVSFDNIKAHFAFIFASNCIKHLILLAIILYPYMYFLLGMRPYEHDQMPSGVVERCLAVVEVVVATAFGSQPPSSTSSVQQVGAKEIRGRRVRAVSMEMYAWIGVAWVWA
jgi:hypothetical protein